MTVLPPSRTSGRKALDEDIRFRLLRALGTDAALSQRGLARETGVSLGAVNALLNRLIGTGLVRIGSPQAATARYRIDYVLTKAGRAETARLGVAYLQRRRAERDALLDEIAALEAAFGSEVDPRG